jgi:hypothetical protein
MRLELLGLKEASENWLYAKDGNDFCRQLFDRHYSRHFYKDGRKPKLFVGPGQKIVLVSKDGSALFVWRKFISGDGREGVNCAIFRNEGEVLSSKLILEAEDVAKSRWPNESFYTYVNTKKTKSDGCCFKKAGWKKIGRTKVNRLLVLEKKTGAP